LEVGGSEVEPVMAKLRVYLVAFIVTLTLLGSGAVEAGIIIPGSLRITDVTPLQVGVVWATVEPASCSVNVYLDREGTVPYPDAEVISESANHPPAQDIGVMKVRVVGLKPDTSYYFQTKSVSKRDGTVDLYPSSPSLIEVRTEMESIIVRNDILVQKVTIGEKKPALGMLVLAAVANASYPVSGWVGDGVPVEWAAIDANNFYDSHRHKNLELTGGEALTLTLFGGSLGMVETQDSIPPESGGMQALKVSASLPDSGSQKTPPADPGKESGASGGGGGSSCFIDAAAFHFPSWW
jgi:hypothetical protein